MPRPTRLKSDTAPNRVATLYHQLRRLAYDRGPKAQLPTMQELRDEYGVSQATITGALDLLEKDDIVHRIPRYGVFVSPKLHRKTVLIAMEASLLEQPGTSPFWSGLWGLFTREAQRRAETKNEEISFQIVKPELHPGDIPLPDSIIRLLKNERVHGVLSIGMQSASVATLLRQDVPLVVFAGAGHWQVVLDYDPLIIGLATQLVEHGCKNIAFWQVDDRRFTRQNQPSSWPSNAWELQARRVLQQHGLSLPPAYVHHFRKLPLEKVPMSFQAQGYELIKDIFERGTRPRPDGILSTDDMMTDGALVALHELGLQPGKDVIIATHTNKGSNVLFGYESRLIISEFDSAEVVSALFAKLDLLMAGEKPDNQIDLVEPRLRS